MHVFHSKWRLCYVIESIKTTSMENVRTGVHPCEKVIGKFFQNQIWLRLLDSNTLCLVCIKRSIDEVKKCQLSKRGYH